MNSIPIAPCAADGIEVEDLPSTPKTFEEIAACIEAVARTALDGRDFGRHDNFFALGLHSVSIARMRRCLEERLGPIPAAALFQHASVAHLAAFLRASRHGLAVLGSRQRTAGDELKPGARELADTLAQARLMLQFGGAEGQSEAEEACCAGVALWRARHSVGEQRAVSASAQDAPLVLLEVARQLHLLAAELLSRRLERCASPQRLADDAEDVLEAMGEALRLCSSLSGPRSGRGNEEASGVAAEEAAVLAVWAGLQGRLGKAPAVKGLIARFVAAGQQAIRSQCTGWGRPAGALQTWVVQLALVRGEVAPPFLATPLSRGWSAAAVLTLQLEELGFTHLPQGLCELLVNLRVMDLSHNQIAEVPAQVGSLRALKVLRLASNNLSFLPDEVVELPALTSLNLAGNRIRNAPAEACECRHLVAFDCSVQSVAEGCLSIETRQRARRPRAGCAPRSHALETLDVSFAGLSEGPHLEVGCGASLKYYLCIGNNLEKCPDLRRCPGLTSLSLGQNVIRSIPPKLLQGLPELRWLSLEANRIAKLPASIGLLLQLRHLMVQGNRLEVLPEELGCCAQLRVLEVQHNRLAALPTSMTRLRSLQFFYAHGNYLKDATAVLSALRALPSLKLVGLGGNCLELVAQGPPDRLLAPGPRLGVGWNGAAPALQQQPACGPVLTELLSCGEGWHFEAASPDGCPGRVLVVCFMAQGAPTAQWVGQVQACRASQLAVDALYVCDPANAWYLQDPERSWRGIEYCLQVLRRCTDRYGWRVLMLGSSMGATACLLFAELAGLVLAFSPQVELRSGQGRFLDPEVLDSFEARVAASLRACAGRVIVHVGRRHHFDALAARRLLAQAPAVRVAYHETEQHNTTKYLHERRGQLTSMVKFAVAQLEVAAQVSQLRLDDALLSMI